MTERIFNRPHFTELRKKHRHNATQPEQKLWQILRGKQMGVKFRRQHGIGNYIVDFYCPERQIVIEVDGDSHYTGDAPKQDEERDHYLNQLGILVLRFTNDQINQNLASVYDVIKQSI